MYNARERSIGLRAATTFPLLLCEGQHAAHCRAVELSASGIVVERGRELSEREQRAGLRLEMFVPGLKRPVRALAKVARALGNTRYALRFVLISDVDRLSLMEHIDQQQLDSLRLLEEISGAA
ncbi:MAG TPA: hypothetical protein VEQ58_16860 [Polyangiaceae bacterium]|nr:hypothetical protein [Polyangiaceae bacterium]